MFTPEKIDIEFVEDNGKEVVCVKIPKKELRAMIRQRGKWACENKPGEWGGGFLKDAVGVGLRGEMAFAKINGLSIDLEPKAAGTGGGSDFEVKKVTIELKTKNLGSNHNHLLVRYLTENDNSVPMKSDIYIAARIVTVVKVPGYEVIHLMGWAKKFEVAGQETVPARAGSHKNKEISFADLHEMRKLLDLIG